MMKPIDKQVQETMQHLEFPYSNAYWDEVLSHIENKEKRRRRIIGFWWILGGIILISAGSILWWSSVVNRQIPDTLTEKQLAGLAQREHSDITENERNVIENTLPRKEMDLPTHENNTSFQKKIDPISYPKSPSQINKQNSVYRGKMIPFSDINAKEDMAQSYSTERNSSVVIQAEDIILNDSDELGFLENKVSSLPTLSISPFERDFIWSFERKEISNKVVKPSTIWSLSLLSELSVLTNVPGREDEKALLGAQTGIGMRLKAGSGFFTGISLGYAIRTGTFGNMLDHPTPEYVFEKKEEGYRVIPTSLSYAQSQLYAGWESGRWSGRAGMQVMYLAGATGTLYNYSSEASAEDPGILISRVSKVSEGRISTPAFREWAIELQAGIEFAISPEWRIIAQFIYTPGGLAYPLVENKYDPIIGMYESTSGDLILKEQFLHIQLGIQYQW